MENVAERECKDVELRGSAPGDQDLVGRGDSEPLDVDGVIKQFGTGLLNGRVS